MKKLILLIALVMLLMIPAGASASVVSDTMSVTSHIADDEMTTSQTEAVWCPRISAETKYKDLTPLTAKALTRNSSSG